LTKDDFKYYLPYVGTILVFLGALRQILYYGLFNFTILPYLELTEALTLFLNDFAVFAAIIISQNLIMFLFQPKKEFESIGQGLNEALKERNFLKRVLAYATNGVNLIILFFLWLIGFPFWIWFSDKSWILYLLFLIIPVGALLFLTFIYELRRQWFVKYEAFPKLIYTDLLKFSLILLTYTIVEAYSEHTSVAFKKKYIGTMVLTEQDTLESDSNFYFIGQTRNFIFFNNTIDTSITVISRSDIKKFIVKRKNN
jgi:hypothetical protein